MNATRRGFLRGLTSLPLIGGSVALIGQPTAAAVPVTDALHTRYLAWLAHEHRAAVREHAYRIAYSHVIDTEGPHATPKARAYASDMRGRADYMFWAPDAPDIQHSIASAAPSSRAAIILSAAGVPLTGGKL